MMIVKTGDKMVREPGKRHDGTWPLGDKVVTVKTVSPLGQLLEFEEITGSWNGSNFDPVVEPFKLGEKVRRIKFHGEIAGWSHGDEPVTVRNRSISGKWIEFEGIDGLWSASHFELAPLFKLAPANLYPADKWHTGTTYDPVRAKVRKLYNAAMNGDVTVPEDIADKPKRAAAYKAGYVKALGETMEALGVDVRKVTLPVGRVVWSTLRGVNNIVADDEGIMIGDTVSAALGKSACGKPISTVTGVLLEIWPTQPSGTRYVIQPCAGVRHHVFAVKLVSRAPLRVGEKIRIDRLGKVSVSGKVTRVYPSGFDFEARYGDMWSFVYGADAGPDKACVFRNGRWVKVSD